MKTDFLFVCVIIFLFSVTVQKIFSTGEEEMEQGSEFEIAVWQLDIITRAYDDMKERGIDLSGYKVRITKINNVLDIYFFRPHEESFRGSLPGYPGITYKISIVSKEILSIIFDR